MELADCKNCGKELGKSEKYCSACGTPVETVSGAAEASPPTTASTGAAPPLPPPMMESGDQSQAPGPPPLAPGIVPPPPAGHHMHHPPGPPSGLVMGKAAASAGSLSAGIVGSVSMILGAIGSCLAWASASTALFTVSVGGLKGDGKITLAVSIIGLVLFIMTIALRSKPAFASALVMSLIVAGIGIYDAASLGEGVSVGVGLWLCIAAGVMGACAAIAGIVASKPAAVQQPPAQTGAGPQPPEAPASSGETPPES